MKSEALLFEISFCVNFLPVRVEVYSDYTCSMKILREFYFADWRFFVVCGNKFLRFEMAEISGGN